MTDKFKELNSPTSIREIYNELVLDEIIKEACKKRHLDYHIYYTTFSSKNKDYRFLPVVRINFSD